VFDLYQAANALYKVPEGRHFACKSFFTKIFFFTKINFNFAAFFNIKNQKLKIKNRK